MQDSNNWKVESVPEYVSVLSEAKLATSTPHNIEAPIVPLKPPCLQDDDSPKLLEVFFTFTIPDYALRHCIVCRSVKI